MRLIACLVLLIILPLNAFSDALPKAQIPDSVGVNIHFFSGHEQDLDMIAAAGFKIARIDVLWNTTEKAKNQYNFSQYDALTAALEKRGITPYYILGYSNNLYESSGTGKNADGKEHPAPIAPQHPESVAAFARWAAAAASHYKGHKIIWEIYNEPDVDNSWLPKPDVGQYVTLLQATVPAMRSADPNATIVAPALALGHWDYVKQLMNAPSVYKGLDAVSVHPYGFTPENIARIYVTLRGWMKLNSVDLPLLSGEWGFSTNIGKDSVEPAEQAKLFARQQLANLMYGIPLSIWYDWKDDGVDKNNREFNFGVVDNNLQPKPAFAAVKTLTKEFNNYHFAQASSTANGDYILVFADNSGNQKLAAWTISPPHPVALKTGLLAATCMSYDGQVCSANIKDGAMIINLSEGPQYISYKAAQ